MELTDWQESKLNKQTKRSNRHTAELILTTNSYTNKYQNKTRELKEQTNEKPSHLEHTGNPSYGKTLINK